MVKRLTTYLLLLACSGLAGRRSVAEGDDSIVTSIDTPEAAVEQAYRYLGFPELRSRKATIVTENCHLLDSADINIPFLFSSVRGRPVWRITLSNVKVSLPSKRHWSIETHNHKSYEALIDSATGVLYMVYSVPPTNDPDVAPEPDAEEATKQLRAMHEDYVAFPPDVPPVSLHQAAMACLYPVLDADSFEALYVLLKKGDAVPRPVWITTSWGIPPITVHGLGADEVPVYQRNHVRQVVDAITGSLLFTSTIPQVPLNASDRRKMGRLLDTAPSQPADTGRQRDTDD